MDNHTSANTYPIQVHKYIQEEISHQYPSTDLMVSRLNALGPAAKIFKIDISRAFRHVRIDPGDIDLLGL